MKNQRDIIINNGFEQLETDLEQLKTERRMLEICSQSCFSLIREIATGNEQAGSVTFF